jgi:RNA polymerase sigma factor (sigma-70 family)
MKARPQLDELMAERAWVARLAYRMVRDRDDADDVAQETLLAALESPPATDRPTRGWLGRIATNVVRLRYRTDTRRARREEWAELPEPSDDNFSAVHKNQSSALVAAAVDELAEPYRTAVVLRFFAERSVAEIAAEQGVPVGTAGWRISEGLKRLRTRLDHDAGGDARPWLMALCPGAALPHMTTAALAAPQGGLTMSKIVAASLAIVCTATLIIYQPWSSADGAKTREARTATSAEKAVPSKSTANPSSNLEGVRLRRVTEAERRRRFSERQPVAAVPSGSSSTAKSVAIDAKQSLKFALLDQWKPDVYRLVHECLEQARVKTPSLFGSVAIRLTISGEPEIAGLVTSATVHRRRGGFEPPNVEFEECLEQTMMSVEFTGLNQDVTFSFPFDFDPPPGVSRPRPPTAEELGEIISRTAKPERLTDLASEHLEAHPAVAIAACDKAVEIDREGASAYSCTIMACDLGKKVTALSYWAGVGAKFRAKGARKKAEFLCGRKQIVLP